MSTNSTIWLTIKNACDMMSLQMRKISAKTTEFQEAFMNTKMTTQAGQAAERAQGRGKTYDMAYIALFAVLMAICSWISIPTAIPFTLQTFAVFLAVSVLGGRRGTLAVIVFVLLGAVGVPVFAEFTGGLYVILGNTGGYIIGFIFAALLMWLMEKLFGRKIWVQALSMLLGMVTYYVFGTIWFMAVYMRTIGPVGLTTVLGWCVIPFIIPDLVKAALALFLGSTLRRPLSKIMDE